MVNAKAHKGLFAALASALVLVALASVFAFTPQAQAEDVPVREVSTMDFFQSKLRLDPKVDTSGFSVTVEGAAEPVEVVKIDSSAPIDNDSGPRFWESYSNATTTRYNRFQDTDAIAVVFGGAEKSVIAGHEWDWATMESYAQNAANGAIVHVNWPVVGTYDGREVGMRLDISNIQYGLDYRIANKDALGTEEVADRSANIRTPLFQISALPQYGLIYENINNADYNATLFFVDDGTSLDAKDVYYTYSSLSTWTNRGGDQVNAWGLHGGDGGNGEGLFIQEMVKPISAIDRAYVITDSNIGTSDGAYNTTTGWHYEYNGTNPPQRKDNAGDSTGYYAAWAGEDLAGNAYDDTVGDPGKLFPRNAVTLHYTNTDDVRFNMLSSSNSQWFTIYPQGLTSTATTDPVKSVDANGQKNVFASSTGVKASDDVVFAGDDVVYTISQKVNTLGSDSIVRYSNLLISDELPDGVTYKSAKLVRTEQYLEGGKILSKSTTLYDSVDGTNAGAGTLTQAGKEVTFTFDEKYLTNDMPMNGEIYYLYITATVEDSAVGKTLSNTARTAINQGASMWDPDVEGSGTQAIDGIFPSKAVSVDVKAKDGIFDEMLLVNKGDEFTYTVSNSVPADATKFTITDALDSILQIVGTPELTFADPGDAVPGADIKVDGTTVTATVTDGTADADKYATQARGKQVTLTIKAKIRDNATDKDLAPYVEKGGIPNTGVFQVNDDPNRKHETNNTVVIPPVVKKVNGDFHADLAAADEEFTYTITNVVPTRITVGTGADAKIEDLTKLTFTDTIDPVLDVVGDVQVKAGNDVVKTIKVDAKTNKIEFTLEGEDLAKVKGKAMTVEFKAVYDKDATNDAILESYKNVTAAQDDEKGVSYKDGAAHKGTPDTATISLTPANGSAVDLTTNTVTVKPPVPVGSVRVEHRVEGTNEVLIPWEFVQKDQPGGTPYETADKGTITKGDKKYEFVRIDTNYDPATGEVIANDLLSVVYLYKLVDDKPTTPPLTTGDDDPVGSVRVEHRTVDGEVLIPWEFVQQDQPGGTPYETADKGTITTEDGKTYRFVRIDTNYEPAKGAVVANKTLDVVYLYELVPDNSGTTGDDDPVGSVRVEHRTVDGEVLIPWEFVQQDQPGGTPYETADKGTITTDDGKTYRFVRIDTNYEPATGEVVANKTLDVVYLYELVTDNSGTTGGDNSNTGTGEDPNGNNNGNNGNGGNNNGNNGNGGNTTNNNPNNSSSRTTTSTKTPTTVTTSRTTPSTTPTTSSTVRGLSTNTADASSFAVLGLGVVAIAAFGMGAFSLRRRRSE